MNEDEDIVSGFDSNAGNEAPFAVDFSTARQLNVAGSTCDVYECTIQRRRVFIKRLKAEYDNNPVYRAAFSKEFDLGVSLSHPSLPRYVGFGGNYIVMDFVEGDTLADLIKRGDTRLANKRFVKKLLYELIDVAEYLHYRNIVHCDIKADNIIISPYSDRPATLIDLDKAYSPWLDSTHGNTGKYGCDECSDGLIDFKCIGFIAAKLGMKKIAKACDGSHVSAYSLKKSLDSRPVVWLVIGLAAVTASVAAIPFLYKSAAAHDDAIAVASDSISFAAPGSDTVPLKPQPVIFQKPSIDDDWISALIAEKLADIKGYRQELLNVLDCDTISPADKLDAIMDYTDSSGLARSQIIYNAVVHYSSLPELDVQNAVRQHPLWLQLVKEEEDVQSRINKWRSKVSRRSSDLLVSPPDTTQDAVLHVQHR